MDWKALFGFATLPKPDFIRAYEKSLQRSFPKAKPLSEVEFLVLDTETTGLNVKKDHVLSYGSVTVIHNRIRISSANEFYLKPKKRNREAIKVHGLVQERPYVSRERLIQSFLDDARQKVLVGHHIGFDLAMLERVGKSMGLRKIKIPLWTLTIWRSGWIGGGITITEWFLPKNTLWTIFVGGTRFRWMTGIRPPEMLF